MEEVGVSLASVQVLFRDVPPPLLHSYMLSTVCICNGAQPMNHFIHFFFLSCGVFSGRTHSFVQILTKAHGIFNKYVAKPYAS